MPEWRKRRRRDGIVPGRDRGGRERQDEEYTPEFQVKTSCEEIPAHSDFVRNLITSHCLIFDHFFPYLI
eukprot:CAMPEP_0194294518 /NCGR_PEP_ID=MMETSP0169-20130528/50834_1 /TAXON_ID=218684 /ORGANISM="Corethron pennatum, Strain L29A3" /LENGTH=68 /DNA_ID=CAMNT_0039043391 /DNA_START=425 /DNA_END=631 /DNA_ORIENTATION=-